MAAPEDTEEGKRPPTDEGMAGFQSRRNFIRAAIGFGVVLVTLGIGAVTRSLLSPSAPQPQPSGTAAGGASAGSGAPVFPRVKVANLNDLAAGRTVTFNYPLEETPNLLAKLGTKAEGGVGPDGDVVAYSQVCQHLGCIYGFVPKGGSPSCNDSYTASVPVGYCCCHGSVYDLAGGGQVVSGPSPRPVPQVSLDFDASTGDIYAVGMLPPTIFGHHTGSDDVTYDLQGGTPVS